MLYETAIKNLYQKKKKKKDMTQLRRESLMALVLFSKDRVCCVLLFYFLGINIFGMTCLDSCNYLLAQIKNEIHTICLWT